jgi:hypothetical protein
MSFLVPEYFGYPKALQHYCSVIFQWDNLLKAANEIIQHVGPVVFQSGAIRLLGGERQPQGTLPGRFVYDVAVAKVNSLQ